MATDDELAEVEAKLRGAGLAAAAELRRQQEELEQAVEDLELRQRDLTDVAIEAMHRGDVLALTVGERSFRGTVVHVGADNLTLTDRFDTVVEVSVPAMGSLRVIEAGARGLSRRRRDPASFRDCLLGPEATGAVVELGGVALAPIAGSIITVATDPWCSEAPTAPRSWWRSAPSAISFAAEGVLGLGVGDVGLAGLGGGDPAAIDEVHDLVSEEQEAARAGDAPRGSRPSWAMRSTVFSCTPSNSATWACEGSAALQMPQGDLSPNGVTEEVIQAVINRLYQSAPGTRF